MESLQVTSVTGHVFSTDFPSEYENWDAVDPVALFSAPVNHFGDEPKALSET